MALLRRHGDAMREDGVSTSNEMIMLSGHAGTHVDSLAHVSCNGILHGGMQASEAQGHSGFKCLGVETVDPVVSRGILIDVCALHGVTRLKNAQPIGKDELIAATEATGIKIREGDVVLVRTGWGQLWDNPHAYIAEGVGVPGPTEEASRWLADQGVRMVGSDTSAYEHIPQPRPSALPGHRLLIFERGINIIEMLNLEEIAATKCNEFAFVLAPLKIVGGTGSPVRPLALISS